MKVPSSFFDVGSGLLAFGVWGSLVLYWKTLGNVPAFEIMTHRMVWSLLCVMLIAIFCGYLKDILSALKNFKILKYACMASVLIGTNWYLYIWSVNNGKIVEASLGYYINPLLSVLIGRIFLKEKLTRLQIFAILIAAGGVFYSVLAYGKFPWLSLSLALTFAAYGYLKKNIKANVITGLFIETLILFPFATFFLLWTMADGQNSFLQYSLETQLLLMGSGVVTITPLLFFSYASKRVQLATLGLMQYIAPSTKLLIGVYIFHEPINEATMVTLICIWIALALYTWCSIEQYRKLQKNIF